jgi:hypothetical protein
MKEGQPKPHYKKLLAWGLRTAKVATYQSHRFIWAKQLLSASPFASWCRTPTFLISALDRRAVRRRFEQRFSSARMATDYVGVYRSLSSGRCVCRKLVFLQYW